MAALLLALLAYIRGILLQTLDELDFQRGLCGAAQQGNLQKLQQLLRRHPGAINQDGLAGEKPRAEACPVDWEAAADVTGSFAKGFTWQAGDSGYTPLHYAARAGQMGAVELLLRAGWSCCRPLLGTLPAGGSSKYALLPAVCFVTPCDFHPL